MVVKFEKTKKGKFSARFVTMKEQRIENFIYKFNQGIKKFMNLKLNAIRFLNSIVGKIVRLAGKVSWKSLFLDSVKWFVECLCEGFIINYITFILLNDPISLKRIIAYGFLTKYIIYFINKLKDGKHKPIHKNSKSHNEQPFTIT